MPCRPLPKWPGPQWPRTHKRGTIVRLTTRLTEVEQVYIRYPSFNKAQAEDAMRLLTVVSEALARTVHNCALSAFRLRANYKLAVLKETDLHEGNEEDVSAFVAPLLSGIPGHDLAKLRLKRRMTKEFE